MPYMTYKWSSPHEWVGGAIETWKESRLRAELRAMASLIDADTLQKMYESDMVFDGYFEKVPIPCTHCLKWIEEEPHMHNCYAYCSECIDKVRGGSDE